ncbi:MAG: N-acetylmuramic acid 6-phosphate etherase [Ruminococcaceae bacterium]|nr:N-acetylmuramic acid 6-phosphate etherase [Oscillospiraceae bacterium]
MGRCIFMSYVNEYSVLTTEGNNEKSKNIDKMNALEIATLINNEDKTVPYAVEKALPEIAEVIDICADAIKNGGRVFYVGAGTSGRLGVLDASECPPTYGTSPEIVQGIIAGGKEAAFRAIEKAEDDTNSVIVQLKEASFSEKDVCIGLSASGSAPCVKGALQYAKELGAKTASIACNVNPAAAEFADVSIVAVVGPEVVSGSTRMKAGTAQKLILNMISTGAMVRIGRVIGNYLAYMRPTNKKLLDRAARIVMSQTDCEYDMAVDAVKKANGQIIDAIDDVKERMKK